MAKYRFFLRKPKATTPTAIYCFFNFHGKRLKISTGESVHPNEWSFKKERVKPSVTGSTQFNEGLKAFGELVEATYHTLSAKGTIPTTEQVRNAIHEQRNKAEDVKPFLQLVKDFIEDAKGVRAENTIKNYNVALSHLEGFEKHTNQKITFDRIDEKFYNRLVKYLTTKEKMAVNSIGSIIKNFKVFMGHFTKVGLNEKLDFKGFKVMEESVETVYLDTGELEILLNLDLSKTPSLDRVRDLFLIGCWTGLRFSDFTQLKPENISEDFIKIKTQKTGEVVTIPLLDPVRNILKKYDGNLPRSISNQKMNEYIKQVAEEAKLFTPKMTAITKGGERKTEFAAKYKLISTHTARRSFATNMYYHFDVPAIILMKITGHKTEKAFLKYIKVDGEMAAKKVAQKWREKMKAGKVSSPLMKAV